MEALGFDQANAVESEAALSAMLGRFLEEALLRSRWLAAGRRRENPDFAVGKNAVNVEKNEFDFAGAGSSGWFRHRRNSSRLLVGAVWGRAPRQSKPSAARPRSVLPPRLRSAFEHRLTNAWAALTA